MATHRGGRWSRWSDLQHFNEENPPTNGCLAYGSYAVQKGPTKSGVLSGHLYEVSESTAETMAFATSIMRHLESHEGLRGLAVMVSGHVAAGTQLAMRSWNTDPTVMSADAVEKLFAAGQEDMRPYFQAVVHKETPHTPSDFAVSVGNATAEIFGWQLPESFLSILSTQ
eukprot:5818866-Amphidinium_carterae.1